MAETGHTSTEGEPALYSVVICTRNRCEVLAECLREHLRLRQPEGTRREYVIVDNGSTDDTPAVVAAYRQRCPWPVRYVLEPRQGHSIALNRGCREARGAYVCFTDDDAIPNADWVVVIDQHLRIDDADWVFGPVYPLWGPGGAPPWFGIETGGLVACFEHSREPYVSTDPAKSFAGVNHACRASVIAGLGYYDEELGLRGEKTHAGNDDDLYRRALQQGCRIDYDPALVVQHVIDASRASKQPHLSRAWLVGMNEASLFQQSGSAVKSWFGVPRYKFRFLARHTACWVRSVVLLRHAAAFHHRLQITRLCGMIAGASRPSQGAPTKLEDSA